MQGVGIKLEESWADVIIQLLQLLLHNGLSLAVVIVYADGWFFGVILATEDGKSLV